MGLGTGKTISKTLNKLTGMCSCVAKSSCQLSAVTEKHKSSGFKGGPGPGPAVVDLCQNERAHAADSVKWEGHFDNMSFRNFALDVREWSRITDQSSRGFYSPHFVS